MSTHNQNYKAPVYNTGIFLARIPCLKMSVMVSFFAKYFQTIKCFYSLPPFLRIFVRPIFFVFPTKCLSLPKTFTVSLSLAKNFASKY